MRIFKIVITLIIFIQLASSCSTGSGYHTKNQLIARPLVSESSSYFNPLTLNSIVVMPLESNIGRDDISLEILESLTEQLVMELSKETTLEIKNTTEPILVKNAFGQNIQLPLSQREKAEIIGQKLDVQGVFYGLVGSFTQSRTSRFGASNPNAVSFRLWLIDSKTKDILWSVTYENHQEPLSENIFKAGQSIKGGLGFKNSQELMRNGFTLVAQELEHLKRTHKK